MAEEAVRAAGVGVDSMVAEGSAGDPLEEAARLVDLGEAGLTVADELMAAAVPMVDMEAVELMAGVAPTADMVVRDRTGPDAAMVAAGIAADTHRAAIAATGAMERTAGRGLAVADSEAPGALPALMKRLQTAGGTRLAAAADGRPEGLAVRRERERPLRMGIGIRLEAQQLAAILPERARGISAAG
jgi:hypothetical protein